MLLTTKKITAKAVFGLFPANSDVDDIEVYSTDSDNEDRTKTIMRLQQLRQQSKKNPQSNLIVVYLIILHLKDLV